MMVEKNVSNIILCRGKDRAKECQTCCRNKIHKKMRNYHPFAKFQQNQKNFRLDLSVKLSMKKCVFVDTFAVNMDKLAEKYIEDHKNPLIKVELTGTKLFLKSSSKEEQEYVEKYLNNLEIALRKERVERRNARSVAEYSLEDKQIQVKKIVGSMLTHFGFQNKAGKFLFPEEALFLLETNRIEIFMNEVPLSIKQAYEIILNDSNCSLMRYKVYKKLVSQGYRLIRKAEFDRVKQLQVEKKKLELTTSASCSTISTNKRKVETDEGGEDVKRIKQLNVEESSETIESEHDLIIKEMYTRLENLRQLGPKNISTAKFNIVPDYCVFLPTNHTRIHPDFYLCVISEMDLNQHNFQEDIPYIFAVSMEDNIAFYRFSNVELPNL